MLFDLGSVFGLEQMMGRSRWVRSETEYCSFFFPTYQLVCLYRGGRWQWDLTIDLFDFGVFWVFAPTNNRLSWNSLWNARKILLNIGDVGMSTSTISISIESESISPKAGFLPWAKHAGTQAQRCPTSGNVWAHSTGSEWGSDVRWSFSWCWQFMCLLFLFGLDMSGLRWKPQSFGFHQDWPPNGSIPLWTRSPGARDSGATQGTPGTSVWRALVDQCQTARGTQTFTLKHRWKIHWMIQWISDDIRWYRFSSIILDSGSW